MEEDGFVEVEIQEFDGKEYMLFRTISLDGADYDVFVETTEIDPDILVFEQEAIDGEVFYKKARFEKAAQVLASIAE